MSKYWWLYYFLWLTLGPPLAAEPPTDPHREPMPETLYSPRETSPRYPLFVHADRALLPDGTVDPQLFSANDAAAIERWFLDLEPVEPCVETHAPTTPFDRPEPGWSDYASIVRDSDAIVVARVTGTALGLSSSTPGTLLRLEPLQWLKGEDRWEVKYGFFPTGELTLGDIDLCLFHAEYPETPSEGDRILVAYDDLVEPEHPWLITTGPRILVLRPQGDTALPRWIRERHSDWVGLPDSALIGKIRSLMNAKSITALWRLPSFV